MHGIQDGMYDNRRRKEAREMQANCYTHEEHGITTGAALVLLREQSRG